MEGDGEPKAKRKMKTASQLEVLEKTYQIAPYPSEALRAELSAELGLTDRQLQMWFCHRRLKARKPQSGGSGKKSRKVEESPGPMGSVGPVTARTLSPSVVPKDEILGGEMGNEHGSGSSPYDHMGPHRANVGRTGVAVRRIGGPGRYYEPAKSVVELRAIAFVEEQLGEPFREDGPALGMEFDPLPPGAFGAPIVQQKAGHPYESALYEYSDVKSTKHDPQRSLHEYQFLPEQPTVRSKSNERGGQSHYFGSPTDGLGTKISPLSSGRSYMHGYEEVPIAYGVPNQMSKQGKVGNFMPSNSVDYESIQQKSPYMNVGMESPFRAHSIHGMDSTGLPSERRVTQVEDVVKVERKRKSEEARIAKEIEAHEKKMRKELERQDILRRKREEQTRKEMERQDRERRKEEERLMREKQREQRREMERREKFLLKESARAEKMKQKELLRQEREAARQKAANDRAVARRLAKESTELIEDERLELMEIAVAKKSLKSILSLDSDTLQNLDSFREMLQVFPPISVQLKKPFATRPWMDSEVNVGNLLMVWKFIITFCDVLGLWPFTLDEFVQAFHDYDSRLLGEIHVALLRTIIKDIEDVARTPSTGLGVNQNSGANPVGGHPHIVEGAYAWGFDIRNWQSNLSPLTWPEILRQFALSADFGPKLKRRNIEHSHSREEKEGNDGIDIISNLRTGAAVENAVAIMRERGYSNPCKSRHRLTPGTLKFAAFHVLSLEGSNGLNILEIADRIQKTGLRDLTGSKRPEASIAVALSRDAKLFARTAPSTYCVRSPYRKNPVDSESILSSAREKIRVFKSGLTDEVGADVDGMEPDDVENDEASESDIAEDPEIDDLDTDLTPNKDANPNERNCIVPKFESDNGGGLNSRSVEKMPNGVGIGGDNLLSVNLERYKEMDDNRCFVEEGVVCEEGSNNDHEDTDIDETCSGEPWVQGLMEGEYSNLSVEDRLNALVALIDVATEGNTIRVALEERLEAATALKKQIWAETQLDKRWLKEEYLMKTSYASFIPKKTEPNTMITGLEGENINGQKPSPLNSDLQATKNLATPNSVSGSDNLVLQQSVYATEWCRAQLKSYIGHKAEELYVYRSLPLGQDRRRNRYWHFVASASCNDPGAGRIFVELYNGGWRLIDCEEDFDALLSSLDVRGLRESHLHALLRKVEPLFKESMRKNRLDTSSIDTKNSNFIKTEPSQVPLNPESSGGTDSPSSTIYALNSETPEPPSSFKIENGKNNFEIENSLRRYKNFEDWMWLECFSSSLLCATKYGKQRCTELVRRCDACRDLYFFEDNHCPTCHKNYNVFDNNFDFTEHVAVCREIKVNLEGNLLCREHPPPRIRILKALLSLVEVCIPLEALEPVWSDAYRKSWGMKLFMSSSPEDLLQVLTLLEGVIKRDFLSSQYQTTGELLGSGNSVGYLNDASDFGDVSVLPWIPQTTSAVALRLMELDSAVSYRPDQKAMDVEPSHFLKIPSEFTVVRNIQEDELVGASCEPHQEGVWLDRGRDSGSRGRGARGRTRGGKSQTRVPVSRGVDLGSQSIGSSERLNDVLGGWKTRTSRGKGGRKRGQRSVRKRPKPVKKTDPDVGGSFLPEPIIFEKSPPGFSGRDEWNVEEDDRMMQMDAVDDVDDDSNSDYDDDDDDDDDDGDGNGQDMGDGYHNMTIDDYAPAYNGRPTTNLNDFNVDDRDDEDDDDDDRDDVDDDDDDDVNVDGGEYDDQGDIDTRGYMNVDDSDDDIEGNRDDGMRDGDDDETSESESSDYSSD